MATMVQLCVQRNWTKHHMRTTALHHFVQTRTRWASIAFSNLFVCLFFGHAQWCLYFKRTHNRNRKGKMDIQNTHSMLSSSVYTARVTLFNYFAYYAIVVCYVAAAIVAVVAVVYIT